MARKNVSTWEKEEKKKGEKKEEKSSVLQYNAQPFDNMGETSLQSIAVRRFAFCATTKSRATYLRPHHVVH